MRWDVRAYLIPQGVHTKVRTEKLEIRGPIAFILTTAGSGVTHIKISVSKFWTLLEGQFVM